MSADLVAAPAFKAGGTGEPRPAGSIPVHLRRLLLASALALAGIAVAAPPAHACSCAPVGSYDEALARSTTAFTGSAVSSNNGDPLIVTFTVDAVEKGSVAGSVPVRTPANGEDCGVPFVVGASYRVFAVDDGAGLRADVCGGSHELAFPAPFAAGEPTVPFDTDALPPAPSAWGEGNPGLAVGGGAVAVCVVAAGSAAWTRRKRRRAGSVPSLS